MALVTVNTSTATLATNLSREGRTVLFSPLEAFGPIAANAWVNLGLFPPQEKIALTTNTNTEDVRAQDPEGGPDLLLAQDVTEATAVYDNLPVLTPDDTVRALHTGSPASPLTGALAGGTISPFTIGAQINGRLIVVRKHLSGGADRLQKVYWHPRVSLQNNGEGDSQNRETLQFRAPIIGWTGNFQTDLSEYNAQKSAMGAIFTIPNSKLQALLDALADEAAAV